MEAVEEALFQDFERWKREKPYESDETHKEDIDTFMETEYAMKVGKGNIFDTIKALVLPPTSRDSPSSSLALENLATCREDRSPKTNRTKRATADGNINCSELIFSRWFFQSANLLVKTTLAGTLDWSTTNHSYWMFTNGKTVPLSALSGEEKTGRYASSGNTVHILLA